MSQQDKNFVKTFAGVVVGLMVFAIVLAILAAVFQESLTQEVSEARVEAAADRIQPIGAVFAGEEGQQALAATTATGQEESAGGAQEGKNEPMSGEQVFQKVCSACHGTGAGGAPQLEKKYWEDRIPKGEDTLVSHAIDGFQGDAGMMPAKGGRPDLSDEEIQNAVEYMLAQVKGK